MFLRYIQKECFNHIKKFFTLLLILMIFCSGCKALTPINNQTSTNEQDFVSELGELHSLGIISQDDLTSGNNITVLEGLRTIYKASAGYDSLYNKPKDFDLEGWYNMEDTKRLKGLSDIDKAVFQELMMESVLQSSDIKTLKTDSSLTKYQALVYITRLLGNTYGCVQIKEESSFTKKSQTLDVAIKLNLVKNNDSEISDDSISRNDFFHLVYKALHTTISRGGYSGVHEFKYISLFAEKDKQVIIKDQKENNDYKNKRKKKIKLSTKITIKDTLSISWILPKVIQRKSNIDLSVITKGGKKIEKSSYGDEMNFNSLSSDEVLELLYEEHPKKINYIRINYGGIGKKEKNYFIDINVSAISIVERGDSLELLTYRQVKNDEFLEFTLGKSTPFRKDFKYCLILYDKESRNPKYHNRFLSFFKCRGNARAYTIEAVMGSISNDEDGVEFYLQEIDIQKDGNSFIIYMTPEQDKPFTFIPNQK